MFSFIETKLFSRLVGEHLSDDEYAELQKVLITDPEVGALISGSGGVRKMRWGATGRGKRGGLRIIYYAQTRQGVIWMLTLYPKNVTENIAAHVLKKIKEEIDG
jgi:mRNA-degrading endonuclease RelE of RelBE toxin-antitoxin system